MMNSPNHNMHDVDPVALAAVAEAARNLAASFEHLRQTVTARLASLSEMADALADTKAVLDQAHTPVAAAPAVEEFVAEPMQMAHAPEAQAVEAATALICEMSSAPAMPTERPRERAEQVGQVLSAWLHAGNQGREVSAADLHKECMAIATELGLGVECLGDARSFGLRLSKCAGKLSSQLVLERHVMRGGKASWSLSDAPAALHH